MLLAASTVVACSSPGGADRPASSAAATVAQATTAAPTPLEVVSSSWDRGRFTLSDGAESEDWGVTAAPASGGPYPVAVLLHGNHPTCPTDTGEGRTWPCPAGTENPNHEGLAYLAEALAARGFVAIAPGLNVQYTIGAGEPAAATRTAQIVDRALDELRAGDLGVQPALVDTDRLVLVGHSVGGQDAGILAAGRAGFDRPVAGVVMLQPALNDEQALPLVDVPTAIVVSECDGDTGVTGGRYLTEALGTTRGTPAALIVLEHANHNFTNSRLQPDAFPVEAPGCTPDQALDAAAQQELLGDIVPELALAVSTTAGGSGWAGAVFTDPETPAGVQLAVLRAHQPLATVPGPGPSTPDGVALSGMTATFCPLGYYTPFVEPGTEACHRPELPLLVGLPQTLAVSWAAAGASLTTSLQATPGDSIVLRALADVADERLTGDEIRLRITTPEGLDTTWVLPIPPSTRTEIPPFTVTHALVMWSTLTVPVPAGAGAVTVTVESPAAGSMQIVSIGVEHPA